MSLRPPPKPHAPSRVLGRIAFLIVLLFFVALIVWTSVINQRIDLIESRALDDFDLAGLAVVDGLTLNVTTEGDGEIPLVLLHDADVAGSVLWDGVVAELGDGFTVIRVDLPGFGFSQRLPEEGSAHTVLAQAAVVAAVIEDRLGGSAVLAGVGLGGKVAAEVAASSPHLVDGLVLVDVDFWGDPSLTVLLQGLPLVGPAFTHTMEAGGALGARFWAPRCGEGGWCPTAEQVAARDLAVTVADTSASIHSFRRTPPAALVPSDLPKITAPVAYVWSTLGDVPAEAVERVAGALADVRVVEVEAWRAHLEEPSEVAAAISAMGG